MYYIREVNKELTKGGIQMKQFRYVINGIPEQWQDARSVPVCLMNIKAERYTRMYGRNWNIEYR